jgi:hypothetical protein
MHKRKGCGRPITLEPIAPTSPRSLASHRFATVCRYDQAFSQNSGTLTTWHRGDVSMVLHWKRRIGHFSAGAAFLLGLIASANANQPIPGDVPRHAAEALALAQKWQRDAVLISVDTRQSMNFVLEFGFRSPSTSNRFSATYGNGRMTSHVDPPVSANDGGPIPLPFLDLPAAMAQAQRQGMSSGLKEASLDVSGSALTWSLQADTNHAPYVFTVNAGIGKPPASNLSAADKAASPTPPSAFPTRMATASPAAEALWQKGSAFYERKDWQDALTAYSWAAKLGHPRAMAVLGNMYREGEGVKKNPGEAVKWYTEAATRGNRAAQFSLGDMYEEGEGVPKNLAKAAQLYEASARQGMPEAQFALGLSYEFGQGVPRNRRTAIFWLDQVAKQGDGRAKWYADWLSRPDTPQFNNETQLGQYVDGKVGQHISSQMGAGNRAGVGGLNGIDQSGRNSLASDLERQGDYNRAATCRAGGGC